MNYYERLGVSAQATEAEIKSAYRRLVKQYHPDIGESSDIDRFREIQEAYETLSDPGRRRAYDASRGRVSVEHVAPVSWGGGFEEPLPPFREIFRRPPPRPPVHLDLVLTRDEARRGGRAVLEVPRQLPCRRCGGSGFDFFGWCGACRGEGLLGAYERIVFAIPARVEHGEVVTARLGDGTPIRARVRLAGF